MPRSKPADARLWSRERPMSYVWAGYGITAAVLAGYAAWVVRRGRTR